MIHTLLSTAWRRAVLGLALVSAPAAQAQWTLRNSNLFSVSEGIAKFDVASANVVWASAYDASGNNQPNVDFTKTTDGGLTWTAGSVGNSLASGLSTANISAVDANNAWAALNYDNGAGTSYGRIFRTTNGGNTWTYQTSGLFSGTAGYVNGVHMFSSTSGLAVGDAANGYYELYTTVNGGTTWSRVSSANIATIATGESGLVGTLATVVGNSQVAWFGTSQGRVYRTTNAGASWQVSSTGLTQITQLSFADASNGMASYYDATALTTSAAYTTNGGVSWTLVSSTSGTIYGNGLSAVPGTPGAYVSVGVNPAGSSYTRNNGLTWTTIDTGVSHRGVALLNATTGWAGGLVNSAFTGGVYTGGLPAAITTVYCNTGLGGGSCDISQVQITGTTLNTTLSNCPNDASNNYSAYPASGSTTATLTAGNNYQLSVTVAANDIVSVWLDANQDGAIRCQRVDSGYHFFHRRRGQHGDHRRSFYGPEWHHRPADSFACQWQPQRLNRCLQRFWVG